MSNWSDLINNPRLKKIHDDRIKILKLIREFFWSQNFVETETPIAVRYPGQEPYLNPIPVEFADPAGKKEKFYLHTSPEFALKKLLGVGYEKIFCITKCFRNFEQFGGNHNTEFTIIEWYRAPASRPAAHPFGSVAPISLPCTELALVQCSAGKPGIELAEIMDDTENLFKYVGRKLEIKKLRNRQIATPIDCAWDRMSMKEVWQKYVGVNLDEYLDSKKIKVLAESKGYAVEDNEEYENIFYKIFLNDIEPHLGLERPIFVYDYPASMCSLSKLCERDNRYAERFELYVGGLEIANAFGELTSAKEQRKRLEKDRALRAKLGKEVWPVDSDFISALGALPAIAQRATAGVALGVDRMVLLFTGAKDINEVIFQSIKDQIDL